jgi:hypothetical protein
MAAKEMYDYLSNAVADNDITVSLSPSEVIREIGEKRQEIHFGDDKSEEVVELGDGSLFHVDMKWQNISEADAGTLVDYFHSSSGWDGFAKSTYWTHPTDGHTYVIKARMALPRDINAVARHAVAGFRVKVMGIKSGTS